MEKLHPKEGKMELVWHGGLFLFYLVATAGLGFTPPLVRRLDSIFGIFLLSILAALIFCVPIFVFGIQISMFLGFVVGVYSLVGIAFISIMV